MNKQIKNRVLKSDQVKWKNFKFIQHKDFKELSNENYQRIKTSIIKNDFVETFYIWQDNDNLYCLDGYHRCLVLKELEKEGFQVPQSFTGIFLSCKNKKDAAKLVGIYSSIYARVTEEGLHQFMHDYDFNMDDIKFEIDIPNIDIEKFEASYFDEAQYGDDPEKEDSIPEVKEDPITKLGDLIELGNHKLLCGDSTNKKTVDYLMDGEKADMVFTDPPYGMNLDTDYTKMPISPTGAKPIKHKKIIGDNQEFNPTFLLDYFNYCNEILLFGADYYCKNLYYSSWFVWDKRVTENFDRMIGSAFELIWSKKKHKREIARFNNTLYSGESDAINKVHPTQKPIKLIEWFFDRIKGNKVVDLFGGSGSTLIACEKTNRKCYMAELDEKYCDVIITRYVNYTGNNKIKINGEECEWKC